MQGEPGWTRARWVISGLLAALLVAGCGGDDTGGSQSFVGKTPSVVLYVNWTRDGDDVTGSLTQAVFDKRKNDVATKRGSLSGQVSGSGVSLDLEQQYGEKTRLTGTLSGDVLELEYLSGAEGVTTVRMEPGSADAFNAALANLRDTAEQTVADAQTQAAEGAEESRVSAHAQTVVDDIAALKSTADASLPSKGAKYDADIARLKDDLTAIRTNTKAALAADSLSVCSSSSLVESGVNSMESAVAALRTKLERGATGKAAVNAAIAKLVDDSATLGADDAKYLPDDAPTGETISRAIRSARRKLRKAGTSKTSVLDEAEAMLEQAKALEVRATLACRTGGT
jgi:hypothetical protein